MAKTLTKKKLVFVNEYMQDFNATRAAKAAGYSAKTATQAGSRLLKDVNVKAEIEHRSKGAMKKVEDAADAAIANYAITAENILASLAKMGLDRSPLAKFLKVQNGNLTYDFTNASPEDLLALSPMISEIKTESWVEGKGEDAHQVVRSTVKLVDQKGVLELLGRWHKLKLWSDRVEIGGIFKEEMTNEELLRYAETGELPERVKERLKPKPGEGGVSKWLT
jgi:Terminase small subunit